MNFKWYHKVGILTIIGIAFYLLKYDMTIFYVVCIAYVLSFIWNLVYCNGKVDQEGNMVFNLSTFGEIMLIVVTFLIGFGSAAYLLANYLVYYHWLLAFAYSFPLITKSIEIRKNINDFIVIKKNNLISWSDDGKVKECSATEWSFIEDDSESVRVGFSTKGWFLVIIDADKNKHKLDLKKMNLNGHRNAMERFLKNNNTRIIQ